MEHSDFNKLPGEIRNTIWEYALTVEAVELTIRPGFLRPRYLDVDLLALTRTCRQIRAEAMPFYLSNRIEINVITDEDYPTQEYDIHLITETLKAWVRSFDSDLHQCLTRLELHLVGYNTNGSRFFRYDSSFRFRSLQRQANLYEAEVFLVYLQKHFIDYFAFQGARLIVHTTWTNSSWGSFEDMVLDFSAHDRRAMRNRIGELVYEVEEELEMFENCICERNTEEGREFDRYGAQLDALVDALDRNPQWNWTSPDPVDNSE